ncbi:MAG: hypothetical protein IKZ88_05630 [Neisseriaceae bacterium]|nr:hypothetical protein [Neisseriaceae bacterium]
MISGSPYRHCEERSDEAISEKSQDFSGSLSTMQNQDQSHPNNPTDYSEIASPCYRTARNDEFSAWEVISGSPYRYCEHLSRHCEERSDEAISEKSSDFSGSLSAMQNQEQSHSGSLKRTKQWKNNHLFT